jgi:transposase
MSTDKTVEFEQAVSRCCGLTVHKKEIVATVDGDGIPAETCSFSSTTRSLTELKEWLLSSGVTHVAMESTGVYWNLAALQS